MGLCTTNSFQKSTGFVVCMKSEVISRRNISMVNPVQFAA